MAIAAQSIRNALIGFSEKGIDPNKLAGLIGQIVDDHAALARVVNQQAATIKRLEEQIQSLKKSNPPAE